MKVLVCLVLVVLVIGLADARRPTKLVDCDGTEYNRKEKICCEDGSLIERPNTASRKYHLGCCGVQSYNIRTQFCCGGQIEERDGGNRCCNDVVYDRETEICCSRDGPVVDKPEGSGKDDRFRCCNDVAYNIRTDICSDGNIANKYEADCAGNKYNRKEQFCCGGEIEERNGGNGCCDEVIYDRETQICCSRDGPVVDKPKGFGEDDRFRCCNDVAYNVRTEICSDGNIANKYEADCAGNIYNRKEKVCCDGELSDYPNLPDDVRNQFFHHILRPQCCGVQSYNSHTQFCCGGQIEERDGGNGCCDDVIYDRETEICCSRDGPVVDKPEGFGVDDRFRCCNDVAYNIRTERCCRADAIAAKYDPATEVCCDGAVLTAEHCRTHSTTRKTRPKLFRRN